MAQNFDELTLETSEQADARLSGESHAEVGGEDAFDGAPETIDTSIMEQNKAAQEVVVAEKVADLSRAEEMSMELKKSMGESSPVSSPEVLIDVPTEKTVQNDSSLRGIANEYLPEHWKMQVERGAEMTPDNVRANLDATLKEEKKDMPGAMLGGAIGGATVGVAGYGVATGVFGALALGAGGLAGIPLLGYGAYKGYKTFSAWNKKRNGFNALKQGGY